MDLTAPFHRRAEDGVPQFIRAKRFGEEVCPGNVLEEVGFRDARHEDNGDMRSNGSALSI